MRGKYISTFILCVAVICVPVALTGCEDYRQSTEPTLNPHQVVTTEDRQTVRETSLEWRERMKEAVPEPGCI